jgi:multiple sugar transport system substrate-binding protein
VASVSDEDLQGTTIRFARFFGDCEDTTEGVTDVDEATNECETIQILTNAFNAENEHGIVVERLGGAAWDTYYEALDSAYAGGSAPDIAVMHGSQLPGYAQRDLLLPLDDSLEATGADIEDASEAARAAVTYEGGTYGLPFDVHAGLVHLNVDLFTEAGLVDAEGKPVMPTSPEEFLEQAETLKAATGANYFGVARVNDALGVHMWRSLVEQQGGSVLNEDVTEATLDTPEAREALDFMGKVFDGGYAETDQTYDAAQEAFLAGETAMLFNGTWVVDQYDRETEFAYQTADFPTLYDEPAIWGDSHLWVVPRQEEGDPARYRAALEFASYLYEHSGDWAIHTGHLAARTSVLESEEYQQAPQRANYVETGTTNARPVPQSGKWPKVHDAIVANISSIWFEDVSVDDALSEAQQQVDAAISQ